MAAPVFAQWYSYSFRDAKGKTAHMRVLIGGASVTAVETYSQTFATLIRACTNSTVWLPNQDGPNRVLGTAATYEDVEDKARLTFSDPAGYLHSYQVASPLANVFAADQDVVNSSATAVAALIAGFHANIYGRVTDTAPLAYVGGLRIRRKLNRKSNIITLSAGLDEPEE